MEPLSHPEKQWEQHMFYALSTESPAAAGLSSKIVLLPSSSAGALAYFFCVDVSTYTFRMRLWPRSPLQTEVTCNWKSHAPLASGCGTDSGCREGD